jgi:cysteine-rich repeat protein
MRKFNIALISIVTLTFLTGCFLPNGVIEGTSDGITESSGSETGETKSPTSNNIPTTTNNATDITNVTTDQQTSSGNSHVSNTETDLDTTNSVVTSSETSFSTSSTTETSLNSSDEPSEFCGNFVVDPGEDCDVGPLPTRICFECQDVVCGDFIITENEECDDGLEGSGKCTIDCKLSFCGDGIINSLAKEECDEVNNVEYDGCSTDCFKPKWVFLTKNTFNANFGGIGEADTNCKKDAQAAGLAGNYKSWLSDMFPTNSPDPNWVNTEFKGWYRMPTDPPTLFAKGHSGLASKIENPLNVLADGSKNMSLTKVWTATLPNGKRNDNYGNCNSWQDMGFGLQGGIGNPQALDFKWTNDSGPLCGSTQAAIYCFEK